MAANTTYSLKVYDKDDNVIKECTAVDCDLKFGSIRKIMALLKIEDTNDISALFHIIYDAWDQLELVLSECFPDMTEEDWDNVKIKELIPTMILLIKDMLRKLRGIPSESKN